MTKLYALPIADTIESYSFNGVEDLHSHYPGWMEGPVVDNFIETVRFNEGFMREHIEPKVNDIFLCNKRGNVKIISDVDLLLHYVSVDGAYGSSGSENLVGLMTDCIEAVIFEGAGYGCWEDYPKWVRQILTDDAYYIDGTLMMGDWALSPGDIFLRNKDGYIRVMSEMDFQSFYYLAEDFLPF